MPISFQCTSCQKEFKVSSKLAGKKIRCKGCSGISRVPATPVTAVEPPAAAPVTDAEPVLATAVTPAPVTSRPDDFIQIEPEAQWIVECDDCGRKHKPDHKLMGKRIRCKCGSVLHLLENPGGGIPLEPLEAELADVPVDYGIQPVQAPVYQAPPPSFQKKPASIREQRRAEAEAMVRAADEKQQWRSQLKEEDEETEWGPLGKMIVGAAMIVGGAVWTYLAWQAGYVFPLSFILMGLGLISIIVGAVETAL